jgi:hypothetical protein
MIGTGDNREVARHAQMALDAPVHSTKLNVAVFGNLHRAANPSWRVTCGCSDIPTKQSWGAAGSRKRAASGRPCGFA